MENQFHIEPEDHQPLPSSTDLILNLSLSVNNNDEIPRHGSSSNSNSDMSYHGDAYTDVDHDQGHQSHDQGHQSHDQNQHNPRVFTCNYCQRKFYSSQALGGHQNAHKRERMLAKRRRIVGDAGLGRSSSMASLPLYGYGTFNHNSLGIQVHSMIHKPTSSYVSSSIGNEYGSGYGYGYGHHGDGSKSGVYGREGWHRLPLHQQPNVGKLGGQGSVGGMANGNSVSGVAYSEIGIEWFEGVRKFSPAADGISGGLWQGVGVGSQLKSKPEELQNIDLSLKL